MIGTATASVSILDESFLLPHLGRKRRIWVYKPIGYGTSREHYPVIYMHDGQNLFDELNAFGREWSVDETLDKERGKVIVIGIDNGAEHRMSEYMLHDHPSYGVAEGHSYLQDIAEVLKPFVDSILRTKPEREHTCIAGSSMGGLISHYAGLYFPHVFGAVGVFSPALWLESPRIFAETKEMLKINRAAYHNSTQRWYFYAGALESETMIAEVASMVMIMREIQNTDVTYQIDTDGLHNEAIWKNYFPNLYKWFLRKKPAEVLERESHIRI